MNQIYSEHLVISWPCLSLWREGNGYEMASKAMEAKVEEWELLASKEKLSKRELLRREVPVVGRFFLDACGKSKTI
jgi:hypothetical protein